MFQDLPFEVIQQIIGHLSTASSLVNLSLANRDIHAIISADDYACFRTFVQKRFPTIKTPPLWRDAARVLTSRSRAWDRRAFIARECHPPPDKIYAGGDHPPDHQPPRSSVGYHPVIDSYETWHGPTWSDRKEVLAWGAAGRLRVRTVKDGVTTWTSFGVPDDHRRQDLDILDVRLLLPHQRESGHDDDGETIVLRRANREIIKVETSSEPDVFVEKSRYVIPSEGASCLDVSKSAHPILAACDDRSIHLHPVHSSERDVRPTDSVPVRDRSNLSKRKRCVKFLSDTTLAVGVQYLQGQDRAPINVYDISPTGLSVTPLAESLCYPDSHFPIWGRHSANVITPLDDVATGSRRPGELFLSGWTDGIARLHDTRVPWFAVAEYLDFVDDGQVLSLLPIGHERFLAGSHQNGCLKTFDMRMPGARAYSYLDTRPAATGRPASYGHEDPDDDDNSSDDATPRRRPSRSSSPTATIPTRRDVNIFLTPVVNFGERLWQPLPRHAHRRSTRYRGPVYSLSSPSPSSPVVYAGIENHVMQLDFVSTDDVKGGLLGLVDPTLDLDDKATHVLDFSCYERPRDDHQSTDPILLRKQVGINPAPKTNNLTRVDIWADPYDRNDGQVEDGWDERWRLDTYDRNRGRDLDWGHPGGIPR
jgi:hypothetical protein